MRIPIVDSYPIRVLLVVLCIAASLAPGSGHGTARVVDDHSAIASFFDNPQFAALLVTITEPPVERTADGDADGHLRVDEVLRGRLAPGEYAFRVLPPFQHADRGPALRAGEHFVVFAYLGETPVTAGDTLTLQGSLLRTGPTVDRQLRERLVHNSPLLGPLFALVVLLPLVALGALLCARHAADRGRGKAALRAVALGLPPVAAGLYVAYEALMPTVFDIRIDLPILWAALGIGCAVFVAAARAGRRPGADDVSGC